jgi:catechol 2,3-dioxygenase-like lactoylglutathione lyase family enzyme
MIGYVTLGSNDLDSARNFYGALLAEMGAKEMMRMDSGFTMYGTDWGQPALCVTSPYNGEAAAPGNGGMTALRLPGRTQVDALHAKAIELGGTCEGAPGLRGDEGSQAFYGAYFRDPEGNKLCAFCMGPA